MDLVRCPICDKWAEMHYVTNEDFSDVGEIDCCKQKLENIDKHFEEVKRVPLLPRKNIGASRRYENMRPMLEEN